MVRKRFTADHTFLSIKVSQYQIAVGESIDINLRTTVPRSWGDSDHEVSLDFRLNIAGSCTYPEHRAGDSYKITLYGERAARERLTFEDIRVRDKYNAPIYRKYRGQDYPVFKLPSGLGTVERRRGTREWHTTLFLGPHSVGRMLAVLSLGSDHYVSIDECKIDRQRWVRGFSLQTTDPAKE